MKAKSKNNSEEMLQEYDFSNGIRGKHYKHIQDGFTVTVYSPNKETYQLNKKDKISYIKIDNDISEYFQTSEEVNNALRALVTAFPKKYKSFAI